MSTIDITCVVPANLCYLFMLIYILISVILKEEMLTCFVTFAFIKCIPLAIIVFLVQQCFKVHGTSRKVVHLKGKASFSLRSCSKINVSFTITMEAADGESSREQHKVKVKRISQRWKEKQRCSGIEQTKQVPKLPELQKLKGFKLKHH